MLATSITKRFSGNSGVFDVDLELRAGEIHTVLGENGAGKSTLMKVLAGVYRPDSGSLTLNSYPVEFRSPLDAMRAGVVLIHQEPLSFPDLSVAENVLTARGMPRGQLGQIDWTAAYRQTRDLFDQLDVSIDPRRPLAGLSIADQQMVELAAALSQDAKVLLMDEPTAALTPREAERLFSLAHRLKSRGVAIAFISHRLPEVFAVSDRITVLRDGRLVGSRLTKETSTDEIVRMMVGRDLGEMYEHQPQSPGKTMLRVDGLSSHERFADVSFAVHAGEIVGVAGLVGAGRTEVAETIFGVRPRTAGTIEVDGHRADIHSPVDALAEGIAYVPEDRARHGLLLPMSIASNTTLASLADVSRAGFLNRSAENAVADAWRKKLGTRSRDVAQTVGELSGGNQQKVVLGKWLTTRPRILIVDEPTRGIDIGAKVEVHRLLSQLARDGHAILMISSDLPEVLAMSDRVLVMREGRLTAELPREQATQESIMSAAAGTLNLNRNERISPSPGTPGEGRGEGASRANTPDPHPNPLPAYRARGPEKHGPQRFSLRLHFGPGASKVKRFASIGDVVSRFREVGLAFFIVLLFVAVVMKEPHFASADTLRSIALYVPILLVMAVGQLMVMANRHIDLSVGSVLGLSAIVTGGVFVGHPHFPLYLAFPMSIAIGALLGSVNGGLVAFLRVPAIIATLGTMTALRGLIYMWSGGRQVDPDKLPASLMALSQNDMIGLPWIGWIALLVAAIAMLFLNYTRTGRAIFAIGSNARAAELRGIAVKRVTTLAFILSGALAGLAGILFGSRFGTINPASVGNAEELRVISAVVVGGASVNGGAGTVVGTLLGCLLLALIASALPALHISEHWQLAVFGLVIVVATSLDTAIRRARTGGAA